MACETCGGNHKHGTPCGVSPEVLQINNQECVLFHKVEIPASMGDETTIPPEAGKYKNVLLYYEATGNAYLYSSDGVPAKLTYATDDYNALANKPSVNGVILSGGMSLSDLGIQQLLDAKQDTLTAGENIVIENNVISAIGGGAGGIATYSLQERYGVDPLDYRMSSPGTMPEEVYDQMKEDLEAGLYSDGYDGDTPMPAHARLVYHSYGSIQGVITDFEKELDEESEEETIILHTTIYAFFFVRTKSGDGFQYKYYYRLKDINYI